MFPKILKFRKNLHDIELLFKKDLIKPFKKFIITDGKYSSGIFGKVKGIFLERMAYKYFLIIKIFLDKNIFYIEKNFYCLIVLLKNLVYKKNFLYKKKHFYTKKIF